MSDAEYGSLDDSENSSEACSRFLGRQYESELFKDVQMCSLQ